MQVLSIHMTPRGTMYLDDKGSKCIEFSPEKGIIRVRNALGYGIMWKKEGAAVVTNQPWGTTAGAPAFAGQSGF